MTTDRNPTDALNQALSEQRMDGAEKNIPEAIAKAFGLPVEVIYRVIFAYECLKNTAWVHDPSEYGEAFIESAEVRNAIRTHMEGAARRIMLRHAIERRMGLAIPTRELIPPRHTGKICNGCPVRLECVAESLHTPEHCYSSRISSVTVVPLRLYKGKVDVEAEQPQGRYTVPIEAFAVPKRY